MNAAVDRALDLAVIPGYSRVGYSLRGLRWEDAIAADLRGRTALVTGGNSGIGEAACEGLLAAGADVHLLGRDEHRVADAVSRIRSRMPEASERLVPEVCDLSDLTHVRQFTESFLARRDGLDILVNNAGVLAQSRQHTADGIELTFATNVLGPFLLTGLLLPALGKEPSSRSRVITVSSGGMYTARLEADDLQLERRPFDGAHFYAHTKRAQVILSHLWSEHHAGDGIDFHAMHPGWVRTAGLRRSLPRFERLMGPLLRDPRQGADTIVWLATAPSLTPASGGFWHDRAPRPEHRLVRTREDAEDRLRLWSECEQLSGLPSRPAPTA